ncbi:MAG: DNA repair protein RadA [Thermodesulfovibrio sp.]|uniref:DNA repair protein RadA n=1 Tax=Thermodesulfovibrio sp. 1176 TaxID=3043424 RepID=UPI0024825E5A|nr:DNA repair protein RadA [Thermodesulfovibrio sp. 1176]MDI1472704.1 DNA repair protein RadA [Thermodesulfovibrio sp. 1176]MDI6713402.1 DNA repair protein RadA [Thermodesulfovibrio sp.]
MKAKLKKIFQCQSCGYISPKWIGRCPDCGAWNSFTEEIIEDKKSEIKTLAESINPIPINLVELTTSPRLLTGINEFDRVLGGGIVKGSLILIGGDPGIGKSTILLQASNNLAKQFGNLLYVSGEESLTQIKLRAERLGINSDRILLLSETLVEKIIDCAKEEKPAVLIIDSIQTVYTEESLSAPGSVSQIRESATKFMGFAKSTGVPVFLIGHVTKEGAIAGPRVLEHLVDTVLYFEGDRGYAYRILRSVKNRFGPTNEIGVFEMTSEGLIEVENPSLIFLSEHESSSGSAITATIEGTRAILTEIQALVAPSNFGIPRRNFIGVDYQRVNLLVAVLEKRGRVNLAGADIFVNVVGGLKITEPSSDLAIISSIVSSFRDIPLPEGTVIFGEVGLSGEVRAISQTELRLKEASRIGMKSAIIPKSNFERLKENYGLSIKGVRSINELLESIIS